jgi:hypothetical protein
MAKARMGAGLVAACLLLLGGAASAWAAPTVAQILNIKPRQRDGVVYSTPSPEEQKACKVELVTGAHRGSSGWLLRDGQGRPLRQFFDLNGDKKIDVWSYYKDGEEVYREVDTRGVGSPNHYRWLNSGGTRWGIDLDRDDRIDTWKVISAEEVSQEVFAALLARDVARFKALLMTEADLRTLKLPAGDANRARASLRGAAAKFQTLAGKLPANAQWGGLESAVPQCVPADALGSDHDLFRYPSRTVRYDFGDKQHEWLQTGGMIQVGSAWKLIDGPAPGDGTEGESKAGGASDRSTVSDPEMQKLLKELAELDGKAPAAEPTPGAHPEMVRYYARRADVLERILGKSKQEDQEQWLKQVADCLAAASQNSLAKDKSYLERLDQFRQRVVKAMPGSSLAAYVTFRALTAEFSPELARSGEQSDKAQGQWRGRLKKFIHDYPRAEDAPEALNQLAMGNEFSGKDREAEAKKWYRQLADHFPNHPLAAKARGAVRRLELVGKTMELSGTTLDGKPFDIGRLHGKVVVVYYWATYCQQLSGDLAKLKLLLANHGAKGVELVCVNLDDKPEDATRYLRDVQLPATHLYQSGGVNSPLAIQYGINGLPNLFLVGKNGKVVSRTVQINDLEDEVKKLSK